MIPFMTMIHSHDSLTPFQLGNVFLPPSMPMTVKAIVLLSCHSASSVRLSKAFLDNGRSGKLD